MIHDYDFFPSQHIAVAKID